MGRGSLKSATFTLARPKMGQAALEASRYFSVRYGLGKHSSAPVFGASR